MTMNPGYSVAGSIGMSEMELEIQNLPGRKPGKYLNRLMNKWRIGDSNP